VGWRCAWGGEDVGWGALGVEKTWDGGVPGAEKTWDGGAPGVVNINAETFGLQNLQTAVFGG
jgi:hypothetical protein